jgi:hypothetical protein
MGAEAKKRVLGKVKIIAALDFFWILVVRHRGESGFPLYPTRKLFE